MEPWWVFTDGLKACILKSLLTNPTQINQGKPYQIISNLNKVWPNLQILCFSAYFSAKHTFPKIKGQLMPMTGVISGFITPKDKTKSNPPCYTKSQDLLKICGKFVVFPSVINRMELHSQRATSIKAWK